MPINDLQHSIMSGTRLKKLISKFIWNDIMTLLPPPAHFMIALISFNEMRLIRDSIQKIFISRFLIIIISAK